MLQRNLCMLSAYSKCFEKVFQRSSRLVWILWLNSAWIKERGLEHNQIIPSGLK